jgi:hypothetical protein
MSTEEFRAVNEGNGCRMSVSIILRGSVRGH